jgi:hypothetical protein
LFKIEDGREQFYQWDIDRRLIISDAAISQVHFCNRTDECSLVCETYVENGKTLVNVPNILLQTDWRINVYAYDKNYTKHSAVFNVVKRSKPESYVYTETEILNYNTLLEMINNIEGGGGSADVDLSDYYTKEETDDLIGKSIYHIDTQTFKNEINKPALEEIYKRLEYSRDNDLVVVDRQMGLFTEILRSGNTLKLRRLLNLDTAETVNVFFNPDGTLNEDVFPQLTYNNINAALVFINSNYSPTGEEIDVSSAIKYLNEKSVDVDLTDYALKSDIPDTSGFTTEEDVNELINTALGVIENGTY